MATVDRRKFQADQTQNCFMKTDQVQSHLVILANTHRAGLSYIDNQFLSTLLKKVNCTKHQPSTVVQQPGPTAAVRQWRCRLSLPPERPLSLLVYWPSPPPGREAGQQGPLHPRKYGTINSRQKATVHQTMPIGFEAEKVCKMSNSPPFLNIETWPYWQLFEADDEEIGVGRLDVDAGGQLDALIGGLSWQHVHKSELWKHQDWFIKQQHEQNEWLIKCKKK